MLHFVKQYNMENSTHKGTELNNVKETWDQNERNLQNTNPGSGEGNTSNEVIPEGDLDKLVKQEAAEYDNVNKEDRILSGERATVNDDENDPVSDQ